MKFAPLLLLSVLAVSVSACSGKADGTKFFRVENTCFKPAEGYSDQTSIYYIGTNFWYGAILGSDTPSGDSTSDESGSDILLWVVALIVAIIIVVAAYAVFKRTHT